jgi:hypothetical protein
MVASVEKPKPLYFDLVGMEISEPKQMTKTKGVTADAETPTAKNCSRIPSTVDTPASWY